MTEVERHNPNQGIGLRPTVGLLLSIGEKDEARGFPRKLDYFRAKPGQLDQYRMAASLFHEVYGAAPNTLDDVFFLSNAIGDVLDVRVKWWGQSGLKGMGQTNLATYAPELFREKVEAWDDDIILFPADLTEVPTKLRDAWNGEPIFAKLNGPDDPRIGRYQMKVYATLRFCLPRVLGLGQVVEITTTGRRSTDNLFNSLAFAEQMTRRNLIGVPFRLSMRAARMRYFDAKEKKKKSTEFYELVLDTPLTMAELMQTIREQVALGQPERPALPPVAHGDVDRDDDVIPPAPEFFADSQERQLDEALAGTVVPDDGGPDDGLDGDDFEDAEIVTEPEVVVDAEPVGEQSQFEQMAERAKRAKKPEATS